MLTNPLTIIISNTHILTTSHTQSQVQFLKKMKTTSILRRCHLTFMVSLSSVSESIKNNYKQWLYFRNILHTKAIAFSLKKLNLLILLYLKKDYTHSGAIGTLQEKYITCDSNLSLSFTHDHVLSSN